ncbi:MAG: polyphosphate kinase 2 family protein [Verrucomicrobiota bacterium]|nr:polyphosphate kinase 2 family protein [Verrucomicrobiota bacterium]
MSHSSKIVPPIQLKSFNPDFHNGLDKNETRKITARFCERIGDLQHLLYANASHSLLLLFQGMDCSGKDGAIKTVLEFVNPIGVETTSFKAPSREEAAHDFLWRIYHSVPRFGNIGIFNRSHYEEVLIVRVLGLQPKEIWQKRYEQINAFEKLLTDNNVILVKFFLHISKEEQAERLQARLDDPTKNWKFESGDLKMRERWNDFQKAYEDILNKCSTSFAPWHLIPADRKWYRDFIVAQTVLHALEKLKMKWPKAREDLSKIKIV